MGLGSNQTTEFDLSPEAQASISRGIESRALSQEALLAGLGGVATPLNLNFDPLDISGISPTTQQLSDPLARLATQTSAPILQAIKSGNVIEQLTQTGFNAGAVAPPEQTAIDFLQGQFGGSGSLFDVGGTGSLDFATGPNRLGSLGNAQSNIPGAPGRGIPNFDIPGFIAEAEQNAAKDRFLTQRGISPPVNVLEQFNVPIAGTGSSQEANLRQTLRDAVFSGDTVGAAAAQNDLIGFTSITGGPDVPAGLSQNIAQISGQDLIDRRLSNLEKAKGARNDEAIRRILEKLSIGGGGIPGVLKGIATPPPSTDSGGDGGRNFFTKLADPFGVFF